MDGAAWWATIHRVAKSRTQLRDFSFTSSGYKEWEKAKAIANQNDSLMRYILQFLFSSGVGI